MSVRTYRFRRGLGGSATEDWILNALAMQEQPHLFQLRENRGTCRACGLLPDAEVHDGAR